MRRAVAALMSVVVLVAILEPYAAAASVARLPACCRRDGKHHCMAGIRAAMQFPTSQTIRTVSERCPMRRCVRSMAGIPLTFAPCKVAHLPPACSPAVVYDALIFLSAGFSSHTDRGPPIAA